MTPALVSVILPTFNRSGSIGQSIASVRAQTYTNWELIIVDDASTDDTSVVVGQFMRDDDRIQYHRLAFNSGASAARNKGIALSQGAFVTFVDSDDRFRPKKIELQVQRLTDSGNATGIVTCGRQDFNREGVGYSSWVPAMKGNVLDAMFRDERVGAGTPFLMVTRRVIDSGVRFDEKINVVEDFDFVAQTLMKGFLLDFVPEPLVDVYHDAEERNFSYNAAYMARAYLFSKYESLLLTNPGSLERFLFKTTVFYAMSDKVKGDAVEMFQRAHPFITFLLVTARRGMPSTMRNGLIKFARFCFNRVALP